MQKITLKLHEFYNLDAELNGIVNQGTGEKLSSGLLGEKLSLVTKYWISDLAKKVAAEKQAIEQIKNDLIKKYGKEDENGSITIPMLVEDLDEEGVPYKDVNSEGKETVRRKFNPDFQQFEKEFNEFLQTEKDVEYKPIKLSELEKVETSENYTVFFKLVATETTDNVVPMTPR
jgi:hypothetical protein